MIFLANKPIGKSLLIIAVHRRLIKKNKPLADGVKPIRNGEIF